MNNTLRFVYLGIVWMCVLAVDSAFGRSVSRTRQSLSLSSTFSISDSPSESLVTSGSQSPSASRFTPTASRSFRSASPTSQSDSASVSASPSLSLTVDDTPTETWLSTRTRTLFSRTTYTRLQPLTHSASPTQTPTSSESASMTDSQSPSGASSATLSRRATSGSPSTSWTINTTSPSASHHVSRSSITPTTSSTMPASSTKSLMSTPTLSPKAEPSSTTSRSKSPTASMTASVTTTASPTSTRSLSHSDSESPALSESPTLTVSPTATNSSTATLQTLHVTMSCSAESATPLSTGTDSLLPSPTSKVTNSISYMPTPTAKITLSRSPRITLSSSLAVPEADSPCPRPRITIVNTTNNGEAIWEDFVRQNGLLIILNISENLKNGSYSLFRWTISAPHMIQGKSLSTGSQPERMGWDRVVNMTCSMDTAVTAVIRCRVPPTPSYQLQVRETIQLWAPNNAFQISHCNPAQMLLGEFDVVTSLPLKVSAARVLSVVVGAEGFVASWFGAQAMVYDGQLLGLVGQMSCASTLDDYMTMQLMYLVAPMTDYGPAAVVFMNMAIVVVFFGLHVVALLIVAQQRDIPLNDAAEIVAFPGLTFCCAVAVHAGICYGTFQIALNSENDAIASASTVGFVYLAVMFVGLFYVLRRFTKVSFVEYGHVRRMTPIRRWFMPSGFWDPQQPRRMFGRMLVTVGAGRVMYVPYQMVLITGFSLITSVRPKTLGGCRILFFVMGTFLLLAASQVAWWRPHRVPIQNLMTALTMMLLGVQCCLQAPSSGDPSVDLDDLKGSMWLVQIVVVCARGLFDIVLVTYEAFLWGSRRQPMFGVLDEDHFAMENHVIEAYDHNDEFMFQEELSLYQPIMIIAAADNDTAPDSQDPSKTKKKSTPHSHDDDEGDDVERPQRPVRRTRSVMIVDPHASEIMLDRRRAIRSLSLSAMPSPNSAAAKLIREAEYANFGVETEQVESESSDSELSHDSML